MLKVALVVVEDETGPEIYRQIATNLEEWLFVRKELVHLDRPQPGRWVASLEEWRETIDSVVKDHDLVFCTVDLSIPSNGSSPPDPRNGLQVVREITARGDEGLRCCVLTGMDSFEVEDLVGNSVPNILFDFKSSGPAPLRHVIHDIKSQALSMVETLQVPDVAGGRTRPLLLQEDSGLLREQYLSRAPYYVDQPTWHVPSLLLGAPGVGRRVFAEFVAHIADAEIRTLDLAPASFAENRRTYQVLTQLRDEIAEIGQDSARVPERRLYYLANVDGYVPGVSGDEEENCLAPLTSILDSLEQLGSNCVPGFPLAFFFAANGESRLRVRSPQARAFLQRLEDLIGTTTDFPLDHVARDVNGWPSEHPRIVHLPPLQRRGKRFLRRLLRLKLEELQARLPERLPSYRGQTLDLADDVKDLLLDKTDWSQHGNLRGFIAALDQAFDRFVENRSEHQYQITRVHLGSELRERLARTVLNADDLSLSFPSKNGRLKVVERVDFFVEDGELLAIVGPSGCGKSSVLRMLAGLIPPTGGTVTYRGEPVQEPSSRIGFIFQDYSLFPWLTVRGNVEFGPRVRGRRDGQAQVRIDELLEVAQLRGFEESWPNQLSGGMQQRVAIVRALANEPDVLLMDEPFGALDVQTRWRMQDFLLATKERTDKTIVFVTHDIDEAVYIADRIYVASPRPMHLNAEFHIPFARHDRCTRLRTDPTFIALVNRVRDALLSEIYTQEGEETA